MPLPEHRVRVQGTGLIKAMLLLNSSGIPTFGFGAHYGKTPPAGWDLSALVAMVDASSPDEAVTRVREVVPNELSVELDDQRT